MDRRSVLRGALTLPVVAAFSPLGGGPAPTRATAASAPASAPTRGSVRHRTWDVERLDRRVYTRSEVA